MTSNFKAAVAFLLAGLVLVFFLSPAVPVPASTLRFLQAGHHGVQLIVVLPLPVALASGMARVAGLFPQHSRLFGSGVELIQLTCTRLC